MNNNCLRAYSPVTPFTPPLFENSVVWERQKLIQTYWQSHPRFQFMKFMTAPGAKVLDIGCGAGGLAAWKTWLEPIRPDLDFYGVDLGDNPRKELYAGFQQCNLEQDELDWSPLCFDNVMASHVLEHLHDPVNALARLIPRLTPGARIYIEIPAPASTTLPPAEEFRTLGWPMIISNFYDDGTHLQTFSLTELSLIAERLGLQVMAQGIIENRWLADQLMDHGIKSQDGETLLYGYWLATGWAHYMELRLPS